MIASIGSNCPWVSDEICLRLVAIKALNNDMLWKQFGPRSGPTEPKLFDTLIVFQKYFFFGKVNLLKQVIRL